MALYTPSSFLTLIKQDIGIKDLPLPVDDTELYSRITESALKEFSIRSPRFVKTFINDNERVSVGNQINRTPMKYRIPRVDYLGSTILMVVSVDVSKPQGYSDLYTPQGMWASPSSVLEAVADIRIAAGIAASMGKAPTFEFEPPDILYLYNGWSSGVYEVVLGLTHDESLSTIAPTQFSSLRKLAVLDVEEFLFNKLKRIDNLEVGIGSIELKIDSWADAGEKKNDLLRDWDEDSSLITDTIVYF